jgi:hypothetical protein
MVSSYSEKIKQKFLEQFSSKVTSKSYNVDYALPISDVYVEFVRFAIKQSDPTRALDIICRPWAPLPKRVNQPDKEGHWRAVFDESGGDGSKRPDGEGLDSIPSWIPSIKGAAHGRTLQGKKMARMNADSLVGVPPQRYYMAAGTRSVTKALRFEDGISKDSLFPDLNGVHYHSMFAEGFVIDTIRKLAPASQNGSIPESWYDLGRGGDKQQEPWRKLPEDFWRTIVADRSPSGDNAHRYYPRLISHAVEQNVTEGSLTVNTQTIIDGGKCKFARDVLERIQSVIWNRHLMRTKDGRLGLVPDGAEKNDKICILYGCSVPVLLRPFEKSGEEVANEQEQRQCKLEETKEKMVIRIQRFWRRLKDNRQSNKKPKDPRTPPPVSSEGPASGTRTTPRKRKAATDSRAQPSEKKPKTRCRRCDFTKCSKCGATSAKRTVDETKKSALEPKESIFYQVIGECYVHGIMNGEAIAIQEKEKIEREIFELR